ncbi:MAG TPA: enoyl-CoA hydratase-related protein [Myxococcota bacterium]|nr:enoyl-CoA hydratase-related protein [Myxococcota bacterium]
MRDYATIRCEVSGPVARVTLHRPERLNGMTNQMVVETHEALSRLAGDARVRVLVLTGAGRGFCPGADLGHFTSGDAAARDVRLAPEHLDVPRLLHEMPAVTLAAVNGACAGAGLGWACGCDLRVAARSANFSTAFLRVAVAGDMALPWLLPRLVGAAKARELSFLCEKFSADEAARIGLVARVWDDADFAREVESLVARLARSSPTALRALKAHYGAAETLPLDEYLRLESEAHLRIASGPDAAEAFRAFVEKREPKFD